MKAANTMGFRALSINHYTKQNRKTLKQISGKVKVSESLKRNRQEKNSVAR